MTQAIARQALDISTPDGHRSQILTFIPATPRGALLFVPALGVPARKYTGFAEALAAAGVATALHELRGLETSNRRAGRRCDWGYPELLLDLAQSRAALAREHGALRFHLGGHSLGAQLAALELARAPAPATGLVIAASGQPWWWRFPTLQRPLVLLALPLVRALGALCGHFPGQRVNFGGREARGVMRDWTRTALTGRYEVARIPFDFERALAILKEPVLALRMAQDPLVPRGSLDHLLAKLPGAAITRDEIAAAEFQRGRADHFAWMKDPEPVASRIARWMQAQADPAEA
jgi:predicted alpha/beta hydrolase